MSEPTLPTKTAEDAPPKPPEGSNGKDKEIHPGFQKRIDQLTQRFNEAQRALETEQAQRARDRETFDTLSKKYAELSEVLEKVDDKVSASSAPSFEEDPVAFLKYRDEQLLKKIAKMTKPQMEPPKASPVAPPPAASGITPQEAVQMALHEDYQEVIAEVARDAQLDPALKNLIMKQPDPYKYAYEYGTRQKELAKRMTTDRASQGFVEGGGHSGGTTDNVTKLTDQEKAMVKRMASMGMTEEKYLARKKMIAERRGM